MTLATKPQHPLPGVYTQFPLRRQLIPVSQSHSHFQEWKYFSKGRVCPHQGTLEKQKIPRGRGWRFEGLPHGCAHQRSKLEGGGRWSLTLVRATSLDLSFPSVRWGAVHLEVYGGATEWGAGDGTLHPKPWQEGGCLPLLCCRAGEKTKLPTSPPWSPQPRPRWWAERRREALGKTA